MKSNAESGVPELCALDSFFAALLRRHGEILVELGLLVDQLFY
jgi:hypothetical protein